MLASIIFLNGMAVMILEMAGARLLAPELGTSVVVWTSLIGVILASLSIGYWTGGKLADRLLKPGGTAGQAGAAKTAETAAQAKAFSVLARLLAAASASVLLAAALGSVVPGFFSREIVSLHLGTVCTAIALFALPSVLCGMVSPYAVRLAITSSETSGAVIGRLNAIGTAGSILGTFLGGFVLLSWFNTNTIILGVAACLLAAAVIVCARPLLPKALLGLLIVASFIGNASYSSWITREGFDKGVPIAIETAYSSMRVVKGKQNGRDMLLLMTDPGSSQSAMYVDDPQELAFAYTGYYGMGTALKPDAKRILMLGAGGYSVPKWLLGGGSGLSVEDFTLDVVELDPGMTRVAAQYFKAPLHDERMRVFHEDARTFVNRAARACAAGQERYDLVFADIFNSWYSVPFHVGTVEAAGRIRDVLADDGIFIMNIITAINGDNGRLLRSIYAAFNEAFGNAYIFPVQQPHNGALVQNVMLMAFKTPRPLPDPAKEAVAPKLARMLAHRWTSPLPAPGEAVAALNDGYAPVERYTLGFLE